MTETVKKSKISKSEPEMTLGKTNAVQKKTREVDDGHFKRIKRDQHALKKEETTPYVQSQQEGGRIEQEK